MNLQPAGPVTNKISVRLIACEVAERDYKAAALRRIQAEERLGRSRVAYMEASIADLPTLDAIHRLRIAEGWLATRRLQERRAYERLIAARTNHARYCGQGAA